MNLSQLYYFRKLAQLQHYTKAAKELFITQPSLSDSISSLEEELGIALFKKEGRNVKLTRQGREFYHYVCSSLNELETGIAIAKESAGTLGGTIVLGCIPTLLGDFLPKAMNGYCKTKNPKAKFDIHHGITSAVIEGVKNGQYDLGLCSMVDQEPDLVFVPILAQPLIVIVNPEHPLSAQQEISTTELKAYSLTSYRTTLAIGKTVHAFLASKGLAASEAYDDEISLGGVVSTDPSAVAIASETAYLKQFSHWRRGTRRVGTGFRIAADPCK